MYRFLLGRRWLGFLLLVVVLAALCVRLGIWQFDRLAQRKADNAQTAANLAARPVPVDTLVAPGGQVPATDQWRRVTATGWYDARNDIVVRFSFRPAGRGVDVLTPLVTADGTAVLIDRGWMAGDAITPAQVPAPASGTVTVTGWLQPDSGDDASATRPVDGQVRAVSSGQLAPLLDRPVLPGYVTLTSEIPQAAAELAPAQPPDLGNGPHFFYGLQWLFFAGLAVFGWFYFAYAEAHPRSRPGPQSARTMPPSTGNMAPVMNEAAGDSRNAAARPNSSGRP